MVLKRKKTPSLVWHGTPVRNHFWWPFSSWFCGVLSWRNSWRITRCEPSNELDVIFRHTEYTIFAHFMWQFFNARRTWDFWTKWGSCFCWFSCFARTEPSMKISLYRWISLSLPLPSRWCFSFLSFPSTSLSRHGTNHRCTKNQSFQRKRKQNRSTLRGHEESRSTRYRTRCDFERNLYDCTHEENAASQGLVVGVFWCLCQVLITGW